jgi:hypothetical protein
MSLKKGGNPGGVNREARAHREDAGMAMIPITQFSDQPGVVSGEVGNSGRK